MVGFLLEWVLKSPHLVSELTIKCVMTVLHLRTHTGKKGFVIPTKSFLEIGITKIFCYNKVFGFIKKYLI